MKAIEHAEVQRIAQLSHLRLEADEITTLAHQLTDILDYVAQLNEVDTDGIEPLSHVHEQVNQLREDIVKPSLAREAALKNAPESDGAYFKVPRVIKD
jgi:aspartyl-tRNA(Asn)/glutamyl-tRNA(Gln) amidotransferase subunit C